VFQCTICIWLRRYRIYRVIMVRRQDIAPDPRGKASTRELIRRNRTGTRMTRLRARRC
jgi:hypothetical protein